MTANSIHTTVAIIGGGPIGLFLACCLHERGISSQVIERRAEPISHSRSIGIHPVSLEIFAQTGLAEYFVHEGIKVKRGIAFADATQIGTINFNTCPPPYPFILTLPQFRTEQILRKVVRQRNKIIFKGNTTIHEIHQQADKVVMRTANGQRIHARFAVGCDGINSVVRPSTGISFEGKTYKDTYIMGDFEDNTNLDNDAAIFLCEGGLIESFPLSAGMRRWVIKTDRYLPDINRSDIEKRVLNRIDHQLKHVQNVMLSSFRIEKKAARTMACGRILLAGDAAHVISPIGGQGMNLGWLDAWDLAGSLVQMINHPEKHDKIGQTYTNRRLKIARKAARRAEFNMFMGRSSPLMKLKRTGLRMVLQTPFKRLLARFFTMRGLKWYPF